MTAADRDAMELAYGLLWMVGCDRNTEKGQCLYLARKALYVRMTKEGQARGITAGRVAIAAKPPLRDNVYEEVMADMLLAIKAWLECPEEKRPSSAALGQRIAEIASPLSRPHQGSDS